MARILIFCTTMEAASLTVALFVVLCVYFREWLLNKVILLMRNQQARVEDPPISSPVLKRVRSNKGTDDAFNDLIEQAKATTLRARNVSKRMQIKAAFAKSSVYKEVRSLDIKHLTKVFDGFKKHAVVPPVEVSGAEADGDAPSNAKSPGFVLTREGFTAVFNDLGVTDKQIIQDAFEAFDVDGSGFVDFGEFVQSAAAVSRGAQAAKLGALFDKYAETKDSDEKLLNEAGLRALLGATTGDEASTTKLVASFRHAMRRLPRTTHEPSADSIGKGVDTDDFDHKDASRDGTAGFQMTKSQFMKAYALIIRERRKKRHRKKKSDEKSPG